MKSMLLLVPVALLAASTAVAGPAGGLGGAGNQQFIVPQSMNDPQIRKANALHDWHAEEQKLQAADGGRLTPEHAKYLQARLAAIHAGEY